MFIFKFDYEYQNFSFIFIPLSLQNFIEIIINSEKETSN